MVDSQASEAQNAVCADNAYIEKLLSYSGIYLVGIEPMLSKFYDRFNEYFNADGALTVSKIVSSTQSYKDPAIAEALANVSGALIISAYNLYLFPKATVEANTIINYHNALLPWHRGVMATVWAVWADDREAGMTWHRVDTGIDTGSMLTQRSVAVDTEQESITLSAQINALALESLPEAIENLLDDKVFTTDRKVEDEVHGYHGLKDRPNDGIFDRSWDIKTVSRFLRAMYAAKMQQVKAPTIDIDGEQHPFLKWKFKGNSLTIKTTDGLSVTIDYD